MLQKITKFVFTRPSFVGEEMANEDDIKGAGSCNFHTLIFWQDVTGSQI